MGERPRMTPNEVMAELEKVIGNVLPSQVPALLGDLECLRAKLWAKLVTPSTNGNAHPVPPSETDKLLTPEEAADTLSVKVPWLYRNWQRLPFARKLSRKVLRFSEAGLRRWQATRRA